MIECPDCRAWWKANGRDLDTDTSPMSRADADYVHQMHRPMHETEVGANRRAEARRRRTEWERLAPR